MMMADQAEFVPGLTLAGAFYDEAVRPVLDAQWPNLRHDAALIGSGSEVVGFDTPLSRDHHWGPRVMLFLSEADHARCANAIRDALSVGLPHTFRGYSTHFGPPDEIGVQLLQTIDAGPVNHRVETWTVRAFCLHYLDWDPSGGLTLADWLTFPEHRLRAVTHGALYHSGLGELDAVRASLAWYPRDVWLYLLATQWRRIAEEEAFVGRCGDVGDERGSRLIAARIVHSMMRLCFLIERQYPPYSKWFGSAFTRLAGAPLLGPLVDAVLAADDWPRRELALSNAYRHVLALHNALGITAPVDPDVSPYFNRPYLVIRAERLADALAAAIGDPEVRRLPPKLGSVNQFAESIDTGGEPLVLRHLRLLYQ